MTQQQNDVLERELHIAARPETVFAFFTDPAKMIRWMGQAATLDPRPGGICLISIHGHITRGEYVEVLPQALTSSSSIPTRSPLRSLKQK